MILQDFNSSFPSEPLHPPKERYFQLDVWGFSPRCLQELAISLNSLKFNTRQKKIKKILKTSRLYQTSLLHILLPTPKKKTNFNINLFISCHTVSELVKLSKVFFTALSSFFMFLKPRSWLPESTFGACIFSSWALMPSLCVTKNLPFHFLLIKALPAKSPHARDRSTVYTNW